MCCLFLLLQKLRSSRRWLGKGSPALPAAAKPSSGQRPHQLRNPTGRGQLDGGPEQRGSKQSSRFGAPWKSTRGPHTPAGLHKNLGGPYSHGHWFPSDRQRRRIGQRLHFPRNELQRGGQGGPKRQGPLRREQSGGKRWCESLWYAERRDRSRDLGSDESRFYEESTGSSVSALGQ